jgi:hypothetical protein
MGTRVIMILTILAVVQLAGNGFLAAGPNENTSHLRFRSAIGRCGPRAGAAAGWRTDWKAFVNELSQVISASKARPQKQYDSPEKALLRDSGIPVLSIDAKARKGTVQGDLFDHFTGLVSWQGEVVEKSSEGKIQIKMQDDPISLPRGLSSKGTVGLRLRAGSVASVEIGKKVSFRAKLQRPTNDLPFAGILVLGDSILIELVNGVTQEPLSQGPVGRQLWRKTMVTSGESAENPTARKPATGSDLAEPPATSDDSGCEVTAQIRSTFRPTADIRMLVVVAFKGESRTEFVLKEGGVVRNPNSIVDTSGRFSVFVGTSFLGKERSFRIGTLRSDRSIRLLATADGKELVVKLDRAALKNGAKKCQIDLGVVDWQ